MSPVTVDSTARAMVDAVRRREISARELLDLHLARIATPSIGDKDVLLRVHAAGLDRGTWHLMTGRPYLMRLVFGFRGPRQPVSGRDAAGTVAAVGSAVTAFSVGDEVYGVAPGSFAEYAVASEGKLARKPDRRSATDAGEALLPRRRK